MSLQLLLENAVKHNVISKSKSLHVEVTTENGHLMVRNRIQPKSTQMPTTKLGLKNIERRYGLISDKKVLIHKEKDYFTVKLPLLTATDQKHAYTNPNH